MALSQTENAEQPHECLGVVVGDTTAARMARFTATNTAGACPERFTGGARPDNSRRKRRNERIDDDGKCGFGAECGHEARGQPHFAATIRTGAAKFVSVPRWTLTNNTPRVAYLRRLKHWLRRCDHATSARRVSSPPAP